MSLIEHAKRELKLTGIDEDIYGTMISDAVLELLSVFNNQSHSGMSAGMVIDAFSRLAKMENLMPLTDDPEEWEKHESDLWQNRRNSDAFSCDRGKTYRLNSEYIWDEETLERVSGPLHQTIKKEK